MSRKALTPAHNPFSDPASARTFSMGIEALGCVWLSGSTAGRFDPASGRTLVEGDLVAQARIALDKTRLTLEAGGLSFTDLVSMTQYLTPAALADMPKLLALYDEVFAGAVPVVNTIVVRSLLRGRALIEIESVAGPGRAGVAYLPAVSGGDLREARARADEVLGARGFSNAGVKATELLTSSEFARSSGSAARGEGLRVVMPRVLDADAGAQIIATATAAPARVLFLTAEGDPAAGGVAEQCREIYARLGKRLEELGSSLDSVVKTTEFVTPEGLGDYKRTADVRREVFDAPYPAATGVVCERLMNAGAQIAVEVVAVKEQA